MVEITPIRYGRGSGMPSVIALAGTVMSYRAHPTCDLRQLLLYGSIINIARTASEPAFCLECVPFYNIAVSPKVRDDAAFFDV